MYIKHSLKKYFMKIDLDIRDTNRNEKSLLLKISDDQLITVAKSLQQKLKLGLK